MLLTAYCYFFFLNFVLALTCKCPNTWVEFGDTCYLFGNVTVGWIEAETFCRQFGNSYLASIDTAEKTNFINPILQALRSHGPSIYWIGGSDFVKEGEWRWLKTGTPVTYTNWGKNEPLGAMGENCAALIFQDNCHNVWADFSCNMQFHPLCEKSVASNASVVVIG